MIPNPYNQGCKVTLVTGPELTPHIFVYGKGGMSHRTVSRRKAASMIIRIRLRLLLGKGFIRPGLDGWTYFP